MQMNGTLHRCASRAGRGTAFAALPGLFGVPTSLCPPPSERRPLPPSLILQAAPDAVYPGALQTFESLGRVVESLQARTAKLTAGA